MRVTNWQRWTRTKKATMLILVVLAIGFMGGMDNTGNMGLGVLAIGLMFSAFCVLLTIQESEW